MSFFFRSKEKEKFLHEEKKEVLVREEKQEPPSLEKRVQLAKEFIPELLDDLLKELKEAKLRIKNLEEENERLKKEMNMNTSNSYKPKEILSYSIPIPAPVVTKTVHYSLATEEDTRHYAAKFMDSLRSRLASKNINIAENHLGEKSIHLVFVKNRGRMELRTIQSLARRENNIIIEVYNENVTTTTEVYENYYSQSYKVHYDFSSQHYQENISTTNALLKVEEAMLKT